MSSSKKYRGKVKRLERLETSPIPAGMASVVSQSIIEIIGDGQKPIRKLKYGFKGIVTPIERAKSTGSRARIPGYIAVTYQRREDSRIIRVGVVPPNLMGNENPAVLEFDWNDHHVDYSQYDRTPNAVIQAMSALTCAGLLTDANLGKSQDILRT